MKINKIAFETLVMFLFLTPFSVIGQKYNIATGLRWGGDFGLSVAERIDKRITLEQNFNSESNDYYYSFFALGKYHQPIITKRFNWFYGGGPGIVRLKETEDYKENTSFSFLMQTGLEFTINRATFYIALEPYFYSANSNTRFKMHKVFALRYVIVKRNAVWKKKLRNVFSRKKKKKDKNSSKPWWKVWKKS